jgi:hypothetical protein
MFGDYKLENDLVLDLGCFVYCHKDKFVMSQILELWKVFWGHNITYKVICMGTIRTRGISEPQEHQQMCDMFHNWYILKWLLLKMKITTMKDPYKTERVLL